MTKWLGEAVEKVLALLTSNLSPFDRENSEDLEYGVNGEPILILDNKSPKILFDLLEYLYQNPGKLLQIDWAKLSKSCFHFSFQI